MHSTAQFRTSVQAQDHHVSFIINESLATCRLQVKMKVAAGSVLVTATMPRRSGQTVLTGVAQGKLTELAGNKIQAIHACAHQPITG